MNIFLTGSTGFLGGKLIKNLVENNNNELYVLVRNLEKAESLKSRFDELEQKRIHLIKGDITEVNCGLSQDDIYGLSDKIDIFYHLAALVKFDEELRDELFQINYEGTKNALELASALCARKFFYVSTAYTVGKSDLGKEQLYPLEDTYNNPYEQSKVESEYLVFSYKNTMDISIFRPAIIVGDSKTGEADSQFTLYGFMRALDIFKRRVMRKDKNNNMIYRLKGSSVGTSNLVPVDYVAGILALASLKAEKDLIYNITNPNPPTNISILELLKEALEFDNLSIIENNSNLDLNPEEEHLNSMVSVFDAYLSRAIIFEDNNTQELIKDTTIPHLHMNHDVLKMIINAYFATK